MTKKTIITKSITYSLPLFPIFVVLFFCKVLGLISIPWFWVFLPVLLWPLFIVALLAFMLICFLFAAIVAIVVGLLS